MSTLQVVILIAAGLAGIVGNAKQSGELPAAWVPYATTIVSFLVAFGASLGAASAWSLGALVAAIFAGLGGLGAVGVGVVLHMHFASSKKLPPPAAAKKDAVTAAADAIKPPTANRLMGHFKAALVGVSTALMVAWLAAGCGQPVLPTIDKILNVVQADLTSGASDAQMASDVCAALGGTAATDAVCAGVAVLIQDAVTILIDSGAIAGPALANARAYQARHTAAAK